jgi:hypothetical protein
MRYIFTLHDKRGAWDCSKGYSAFTWRYQLWCEVAKLSWGRAEHGLKPTGWNEGNEKWQVWTFSQPFRLYIAYRSGNQLINFFFRKMAQPTFSANTVMNRLRFWSSKKVQRNHTVAFDLICMSQVTGQKIYKFFHTGHRSPRAYMNPPNRSRIDQKMAQKFWIFVSAPPACQAAPQRDWGEGTESFFWSIRYLQHVRKTSHCSKDVRNKKIPMIVWANDVSARFGIPSEI